MTIKSNERLAKVFSLAMNKAAAIYPYNTSYIYLHRCMSEKRKSVQLILQSLYIVFDNNLYIYDALLRLAVYTDRILTSK